MSPAPVRALPPGYREVEHLVVTEGRRLLWLNLLSLIPLAVALVIAGGWWLLVVRWRGAMPGAGLPWWAGILLILLLLPLHELIHAGTILLVGHTPRLGAKLDKGVLYATADGALFRRGEFIAVALAPLLLITVAGMGLMLGLPDNIGYWAVLGVALNAASSIGDLWMSAVVWRYPANSLVRDEADGIRIYRPKVV
jgi:hypothetical protein